MRRVLTDMREEDEKRRFDERRRFEADYAQVQAQASPNRARAVGGATFRSEANFDEAAIEDSERAGGIGSIRGAQTGAQDIVKRGTFFGRE